jgi:hypothetical protein
MGLIGHVETHGRVAFRKAAFQGSLFIRLPGAGEVKPHRSILHGMAEER